MYVSLEEVTGLSQRMQIPKLRFRTDLNRCIWIIGSPDITPDNYRYPRRTADQQISILCQSNDFKKSLKIPHQH
jgi:hypothetical protein